MTVPRTLVQCPHVVLDVSVLAESASERVPWPAETSSRLREPCDLATLPEEVSELPGRLSGPLVLAPSEEEAAEVDSNAEAAVGQAATVEVSLSR